MSKKLKKILTYAVANDVIKTYVIIFLNLYLWTQEQSISHIVLLNVSTYIMWFIVFPMGVNLIHKKGVKFVYRTSAIANVFLFLSILFVPKDNINLWIIIVGLFNGISRAIYSSGKNVSVSLMAEKKEIGKYYQYEVLYMRMAQIITPIIFGAIIYFTNYVISFVFMLIYSMFLYMMVETLDDIKNEEKEFDLFKNFFEPLKSGNKAVKMLPFSYLLGGTFPEFQAIFLSVFTFTITENQIGVALLNVTYSLVIMLLIKITNKYKNIKGYIWLYVGAMLGFVGFGMMYFENYIMLIVANILIVSGTFYYSTTYYSQQLEVIQKMGELEKMKMIIIRENGLILARLMLLTIVILLGVKEKTEMLPIAIFVIAITLIVPSVHKKMIKK